MIYLQAVAAENLLPAPEKRVRRSQAFYTDVIIGGIFNLALMILYVLIKLPFTPPVKLQSITRIFILTLPNYCSLGRVFEDNCGR